MMGALPYNQSDKQQGINPKKFMMMLAMASIVMLFASFTSALIVKRSDFGYWKQFELPISFVFSTLAIVLSSVSLQLAYMGFKKEKSTYKIWMVLALLLGLLFGALQLYGFKQLKDLGLPLMHGNVSVGFLYVISLVHLAHIAGGLVVLFITTVVHFRLTADPLHELKRIIDSRRKLNFELLLMYWHFIGVLWIYLFVFFKIVYN